MKHYFFEKWIIAERQEQVQTASYGPELAMLKLQGEGLFRQGTIDNSHLVDLLILEGELALTANGARITLLAPAYIDFIGSNIWSWQNMTTSPDFKGLLIGMTQPFFREVVDMLNIKIGNKIFNYMQSPFWSLDQNEAQRLYRLLDILFDSMANTRHISLRDLLQNILRSYLSELMDIFFRQKQLSNQHESQKKNDIIVQFLYLLNNHYIEHHEVKWYAEQLHILPNALSVALKNAYGQNANSLIDERLLEKAKQYLANQEYSIQQIADMLSFSDQSAFGKFFKRNVGCSPKEYRNKTSG